jgi:hypothetical protein
LSASGVAELITSLPGSPSVTVPRTTMPPGTPGPALLWMCESVELATPDHTSTPATARVNGFTMNVPVPAPGEEFGGVSCEPVRFAILTGM